MIDQGNVTRSTCQVQFAHTSGVSCLHRPDEPVWAYQIGQINPNDVRQLKGVGILENRQEQVLQTGFDLVQPPNHEE